MEFAHRVAGVAVPLKRGDGKGAAFVGVARPFILPQNAAAFAPKKRFQLGVKRFLDVIVSAAALLVLLPAFLLIALVLKLDSPGPVFFSQIRWGLNGRKFEVLKFRSMRTDSCDRSGVAQTVANDPRLTRVGAILRRTNIDELPQLLNVLRGDMSIVGPRCHAVNMLAAGRLYEELVPEYHRRHAVRPGITGLAQIRGLRGPTVRACKARARVLSDLYYIDNFSLWLDIKIIMRTIINEIRGGSGF